MTGQSQYEAQIRELMAEREAAMRAKDPERLISGYAPEVVKFDLAPPLRHSSEYAHDVEALRGWFAKFDDTFDFEIRDLTVTAGEDVAFCHSLNRMGTTKEAPEQFQLWFRATICLRKIDGRWRITHEHESTPFYMDGSFTAATDLEP